MVAGVETTRTMVRPCPICGADAGRDTAPAGHSWQRCVSYAMELVSRASESAAFHIVGWVAQKEEFR